MKTNLLTLDETDLLCQIINHLGTGQHPFATPDSLSFFVDKYIKNLLNKAKRKVTPTGLQTVLALENKLFS